MKIRRSGRISENGRCKWDGVAKRINIGDGDMK